jgi:hypothetical protein
VIPIEFLNLVIKRSALDRVYPGGSSAFIKEREPFDGRVKAFDESLVKFGAMGSNVINKLAQEMESIGLVGITRINNQECWADFCVIDQLMGPTACCKWIRYDRTMKTACFFEI